jgi:hypothetical protein
MPGKGKFKKKIKKIAQSIKNKFNETVTRDTTRPVVNELLKNTPKGNSGSGRKYSKGGIIQHD